MNDTWSRCVVEGYSLQLSPRVSHATVSDYEGQWMSELLPVTGEVLCITFSISVPQNFSILAKLISDVKPATVYKTESGNDGPSAMDLFSRFEVQMSADNVTAQLVIYVSVGVVINTVTMSIGHCPNNGT